MSMLLLDALAVPAGFADDPIASHSGQFGLARPAATPVGYDYCPDYPGPAA